MKRAALALLLASAACATAIQQLEVPKAIDLRAECATQAPDGQDLAGAVIEFTPGLRPDHVRCLYWPLEHERHLHIPHAGAEVPSVDL